MSCLAWAVQGPPLPWAQGCSLLPGGHCLQSAGQACPVEPAVPAPSRPGLASSQVAAIRMTSRRTRKDTQGGETHTRLGGPTGGVPRPTPTFLLLVGQM